ncbi:MAG: carboxymuconolactone decarboxylase family protein [Longimicrobiales bacterium]|nr:carboxymuconolactone decarboxylase family protein [Longimicrobiales bacterium]
MDRFDAFRTGNTPEESTSMVADIESKYGHEPNIIEGIKRSPQLLRSYVNLSEAFERTSLTPEEQQIVLLTVSRFNECEYCTSVHSLTAEQTDLEWNTVERIRNRESLEDERHEALRTFTEHVVNNAGHVPHDVFTRFKSAGFDERNALDVIVGVTLKTLTNTSNHLMDTPLDEQFEKRRWSAEATESRAATA